MGGSSTTSNTSSSSTPTGPEAGALSSLISGATTAYNQASAVPAYTGNFVAGATPDATNALTAALANNTAATTGTTTGIVDSTAAANSGLANTAAATSGLTNFANTNSTAQNIANAQAYSDPSVIAAQTAAAMQAPTENYLQNIVPGLNTTGAKTGNNLSTRQGITQGIAAQNLNQDAANTSATLTANAYNTGLADSLAGNAQQLSALSSLGSLGNTSTATGLSGLASGATSAATNATSAEGIDTQQQTDAQAGLTNAIDAQNYQVTQPYQASQLFGNLISGLNTGTQTTGTGTTTTDPSLLSSLGAGTGVLASLLKCDRSTKTNIRKVGMLDNGLPIYLFSYLDDPDSKPVFGPMADEVEAFNPTAVKSLAGILHVDTTILFEAAH